MAKQVCPECGCSISGGRYEKGGVVYCCEPCANGSPCECGCCQQRSANMPDSGAAEGGGEPG